MPEGAFYGQDGLGMRVAQEVTVLCVQEKKTKPNSIVPHHIARNRFSSFHDTPFVRQKLKSILPPPRKNASSAKAMNASSNNQARALES
jgi:hypothetical protein